MPVLRTCGTRTLPQTPRRSRISISSVSPGGDQTRENTPESPIAHIQRSRALRRNPSMIFTPLSGLRDNLLHSSNEEITSTVSGIPYPHLPTAEVSVKKEEEDDFDLRVASPLSESMIAVLDPAVDDSAASSAEKSNEIDPATISTFQPLSAPTPQSETSLLLQLDTYSGPGLSEEQFCDLIVRCHVCRKYMTRGTIKYHDCKGTLLGKVDRYKY